MKRLSLRTMVWSGLALLLAGFAGFVVQGQYFEQLQLASGFKAKTLAAGLFIQGLDLQRLEDEDSGFNGLFRLLPATIDEAHQRVTTSLLGTGWFQATAIRIPGLGAVLLAGADEETVRGALRAPTAFPIDSDPKRGRVALTPPNPALEKALDLAFTEDTPGNPKRTRAVVVLVGDKIAAERYAPGITADTRLLSWSMAKSFTNALVGILVREGRLDILAPAAVPEWNQATDPHHGITLDQLMRMSSGLSFFEDYTEHPVSDVNQMLFLDQDFAHFAATRPLAAPPDTVWNYSSGTTNIVSRIIRQTLGDEEVYRNFPYRELFGPLGMVSAEWGVDASGTFVGSSYLYATARDYAQFGRLLLSDGVWNGHRILPEGWVKYSTTPTRTKPDGGYGAFFWLNTKRAAYPDLPADLSYADGHNGQEIFFCPSLDFVVVRLGMTWEGDWGSGRFLSMVRKALNK